MRKTMLILSVAAFAILGVAMAQVSVNLDPTTGGGGTYTVNTGDTATQAAVDQTVNLILPKAYGIAIDDAATLNFDLGNLGTADSPNGQIVCVSGVPNDKGQIADVQTTNGWYPLNTHYTVNTFPSISIQGGAQSFTYPPIAYNQDGTVNTLAKTYLVCYKSFILEKFTNVPGWTVSVSRTDTSGSLGEVFVQDNICSDFGAATSLLMLPDQGTIADLFAGASINALGETTGTASQECGYTSPSSWLNDLVVLAIEIDGQPAGTSTSTITYTILSTNPS